MGQLSSQNLNSGAYTAYGLSLALNPENKPKPEINSLTGPLLTGPQLTASSVGGSLVASRSGAEASELNDARGLTESAGANPARDNEFKDASLPISRHVLWLRELNEQAEVLRRAA